MDPRPRLVLDDDGLEDRNNGMGVIAWEDIARISDGEANGAVFINLFVRNEEEYLSRVSNLKRKTLQLNKKLGYSSITIAMAGIKLGADELMRMIRARMR